jgi:transcriptional regulator with XRE-family HTH domain
MKKYFFTEQISRKFRSIDDLPKWLSNYPEFKDQIKLLRETLGMTQDQLAKLVNRSLRSIQQIESGDAMPKISTLYKISNALNSELKITLIPRQNIIDFLDKKAAKRAAQLVSLSRTSSALEIQSPSDEEIKLQVESLKREILDKKRDRLWDQNRAKK